MDNSCEKAGTFVEGAENLKLFFAKSPVDVALAVEANVSVDGEFVFPVWEVGENENEGRDFPFGKGSGTAVVTSGIGLTTSESALSSPLSLWV